MEVFYIHQDNLITMTSRRFALYVTCLCLWGTAMTTNLSPSVRQESGFISANVGDTVTLRCFYEDNVAAVFFWYKQSLGQEPRLISSFYKHDKNGTFIDELKNDPRFTLETNEGKNHLTISDLRTSDSATYYCIGCFAYMFTFAEGTIVSVKGSGLDLPPLVHQSASETIQPGGSVTLNCTVHTGTCDGEHSVYWFKNSEKSHPRLIYTYRGKNDQCERKSNTQTHTCVYSLPMESLNLSDAGTYYCAVASCGHVVFGEGNKLEFEHEENSSDYVVYFLSGALVFTTILVVILAFSVYKMSKRKSCQCTESQRVPASTTTDEGNQDADLHYAALRINKARRPRRQRDDTKNDCVYSSVRQ